MVHSPRFVFAFLLATWMLLEQSSLAQERFLSLEVYSERQAEIGLQQRWMEVLSKCGADRVRSKSSRATPNPKVEELDGKSILVVGRLHGQKLLLPGRTFTLNQAAQITDYFKELKADGADVTLAEKLAFGLTSPQLVEVHEQLAAKIDTSTKGQPAGEMVAKLLGKQRYQVHYDTTARRVLRGNAAISEELEGLSIGTGVAAIVRPLGLVLCPKRARGKEIEIHIVAYDEAEENWPVGWPKEEAVSKVVPKMFDRIELEIRGFALSQTLNALQTRIGIPFLYDQNAMARQGIEPENTQVTLVHNKIAHAVALSKLLSQSRPRLKHELRLDENNEPFLWISPMTNRR